MKSQPGCGSRVQTDPGKPGKTVNFKKNQGNSGKTQGIFFFKTQIETYWHIMINAFLSFALCMLYLSEFSF